MVGPGGLPPSELKESIELLLIYISYNSMQESCYPPLTLIERGWVAMVKKIQHQSSSFLGHWNCITEPMFLMRTPKVMCNIRKHLVWCSSSIPLYQLFFQIKNDKHIREKPVFRLEPERRFRVHFCYANRETFEFINVNFVCFQLLAVTDAKKKRKASWCGDGIATSWCQKKFETAFLAAYSSHGLTSTSATAVTTSSPRHGKQR